MSSDASVKIDVWLTIGFGAGLCYFYKGFRVFREYRVLMDTPEIPIRSAAMGLVEIHGKATGIPPIPSPVTQTPCYFYKVDIEHWVTDKNGGHWNHLVTDADGMKFYLADNTGKVLVDAHQAEYDLPQTTRVETGRGPAMVGRLVAGIDGPARPAGAPEIPADLWTYASKAVARRKGSGIFGGATGNGQRYRLTEYLVAPEHWYDITGTCAENPQPQDENDRNMIMKGTNEPTFLITFRSEKEIRRTLRNRAAQYIFGGAIAAVVCLGIFLAKHGAF
ncbi:MAG: hypothetical protein ACLQVG_31315 [Terriglobia bacterium]